jgi:hypothetical protein
MRTIQTSVWVACVLLWAGAVNADTVSIRHTMDYEDNDWLGGVWFVAPAAVLNGDPYCRNSTEDWGWTHVVADRVPHGATGITSATVTIVAWKIDVEMGEDDVVYALPEAPASTAVAQTNGTRLGQLCSPTESPTTVTWASDGQINGYEDLWSITEFKLPAEVIEDLWTNGQVCFYVDIDQTSGSGMRATLASAVLQIDYIAPTPEVTTIKVYRFWSDSLSGHFYAAGDEERDYVLATYPDAWTYEGFAFSALADDSDTMSVPVHRFWSPTLSGHFYTADEDEANYVIENYPDAWTYEGIVFYAYPKDYQAAYSSPVHRFWSNTLSRHFYTSSDDDVTYINENYSSVWTYEGIAWYAPESKIQAHD